MLGMDFGMDGTPRMVIPAVVPRSMPMPSGYASWGICSISQKKKSVFASSIPNNLSLAAT
jgi:hypothetical protein